MSTKCMFVKGKQESMSVSCPQNVCLFHVHKMFVCFISTKCMFVIGKQESMSVSCPQNVCLFHVHKMYVCDRKLGIPLVISSLQAQLHSKLGLNMTM